VQLEIGTGLFVLLGFAALFFLTTQLPGSGLSLGTESGYRVTAKFDNVGDLKGGSPVAMAGVTIGRVEKVGFDPTDYRAVVTLRIAPEYRPDPGGQRRQHPDPGPAGRQVRRHRAGRLGNLPAGRRSNRVHAVGDRAGDAGQQVLCELRRPRQQRRG
jgi:hypothetical protein